MPEAEFEADISLAFAAPLCRHLEIDRGRSAPQLFRGEIVASVNQGAGSEQRPPSPHEQSRSGNDLYSEHSLRHPSRRSRQAAKAQPVTALGQLQIGPPAVKLKALRFALGSCDAIGAWSDPAFRETAEKPPFPRQPQRCCLLRCLLQFDCADRQI